MVDKRNIFWFSYRI